MSIAAQPARPLTRDEALEAVHAGATLVTGNDRLARALRQAYNEKRQAVGETVWPSARIHSWGVWVDRLWRDLVYRSADPLPVRLTADQELELWKQAIAASRGSGDLLALDSTAEQARQAAKLAAEWRLPDAELEAAHSEDVQSFLSWRAEVARRCAAHGWTSGAGAVDALILRQAGLESGQLLLAGFDDLTPQQGALLDAFRAVGGVARDVGPDSRGDCTAVRVDLASRRDELRAAAAWARRLVDSGVPGKIGVVLPSLQARRQEVERIFLEAFDESALLLNGSAAGPGFVISVGLPLDRYPLIHAALLALELHPERMDLSTFGAWLRCPAIAGGEAERSARGLLDRLLRSKGVARVTPRKLGPLLGDAPQLLGALKLWARRHRGTPELQAPAQWAETFSRWLAALGWPGEGASSNEGRQSLLKWSSLLGELAGLGAVVERWDLAEARSALARMARATPFQPQTSDAKVEVMSLLESAGAELDHLWVAGLDDETWPDEPRPNPFLPMAVQRERGLPHASVKRELDFARVETQRLLASAPHVVVSHARAEEDRPLAPSPLIAGIRAIPLEEAVSQSTEPLVKRLWAAKRIETTEDASGPPLAPGGVASGGTKVFAHQAHCPFRAFAELRLGARPLDTASPGLAPWERGQLVHEALEQIWTGLESSDELRRRNPGALRQTVADGIDHAIQKLVEKRREPLPVRFEKVERARLAELLLEWLEVEKQHRADAFRVVEREQRREVDILGVRADVRVDRVDELSDGRRLIVDYKTGKTSPKEWDHERPLEPQLPLYAISEGKSFAGALFARLNATELKFEGAAAPDVQIKGVNGNKQDLAERVEQWRRNLEALAAAFLAGRAEVDPRDGKCRFCELPALCRKDEVHDAG